jgi:hypothetical protein
LVAVATAVALAAESTARVATAVAATAVDREAAAAVAGSATAARAVGWAAALVEAARARVALAEAARAVAEVTAAGPCKCMSGCFRAHHTSPRGPVRCTTGRIAIAGASLGGQGYRPRCIDPPKATRPTGG